MELVHEELERIIQSCITKEFRRFPRLVERLKEVVTQKVFDVDYRNYSEIKRH